MTAVVATRALLRRRSRGWFQAFLRAKKLELEAVAIRKAAAAPKTRKS
jgi:hypothetical protein